MSRGIIVASVSRAPSAEGVHDPPRLLEGAAAYVCRAKLAQAGLAH